MEAQDKISLRQRITGAINVLRGIANPKAASSYPVGRSYDRRYATIYNGEKNFGEMSPIKYFLMDYYALRLRSWQAWIENPQAQTIMNKYSLWVIGKGLKTQSEPNALVINNPSFDPKQFSELVEARWKVFSNSRMSDYSGMKTFNQIQHEVHKNTIAGGDVLVILRYIDGFVKVQVVDGAHLVSPLIGSEWFPMIAKNGNRVINGVEISATGEHIAYYVRRPADSVSPFASFEVDRIQAKGENSNLNMAFLVYGLKYRLDNHRGIPIIAAALEKLNKIERYEDATLGSAEEKAKITYQIVHEVGATGENPWTKQLAVARDLDISNNGLGTTDTGTQLAADIQASTNKQAVNNPPGAEVKPLKSNEDQLYFKDFLEKNMDIVCSMVMMPPEVAMSRYNSNYSASRAAIKDWEHVLNVTRENFAIQFNQKVYDFWLEIEILTNKIQAPGYLLAKYKGDEMVLEAYRTARFVGAPVANIDPLKEVMAERAKLGITGDAIPLTTVEAATENLSGGDSDHNVQQYSLELEESIALGIKIPEPPKPAAAPKKD